MNDILDIYEKVRKLNVTWRYMIERCYNKKRKDYPRYGGLGISVCDRWRFGENGVSGFHYFVRDMGLKPTSKHSIDRINSSGNYEPSNCRWANIYKQSNNTKSNKFIVYNNKTKTQAEWAREFNLSQQIVYERIKAGWPLDLVFRTPVKGAV